MTEHPPGVGVALARLGLVVLLGLFAGALWGAATTGAAIALLFYALYNLYNRFRATESQQAGRSNPHIDGDQIEPGLSTALLKPLSVGLVGLDEHLHIRWYNDEAARLLQMHNKDTGKPLTFLLRSRETVHWLEIASRESLQFQTSGGIDVQCDRTFDDDGNSVLVMMDITRIRQLEEISHRLLSPPPRTSCAHRWTVLHGWLEELVENSAPDNPLHDRYRRMFNQSRHMEALVNALLELSEMESSRTAEMQPIPLRETLERIIAQRRPSSHRVQIDIPPNFKTARRASHPLQRISKPD